MTPTSHDRCYPSYWDGSCWRYEDNGQIVTDDRPCPRCGMLPTLDGHDACSANLAGMGSVCCGHGVYEPYFVTKEVLIENFVRLWAEELNA